MTTVRKMSLITLILFILSMLALFPTPVAPPTAYAATINENENSTESGFNDTSGTAQMLSSIGRNSPVHAAIGQPGDVDWYKFAAINGRTYVVELFDVQYTLGTQSGYKCTSYGRRGIYARFYRSDGTTQITTNCNNNGGGNVQITVQTTIASGDGTYYIRVEAHSNNVAGSYKMRILPQHNQDGADWDPTTFEPNNTAANAYEIQPGREHALTSTIEQHNTAYYADIADEDWYRFEATSGRTYAIEVFQVAPSLAAATGYKCTTYGRKGLWLYLIPPSGTTYEAYNCENYGGYQVQTRLSYKASSTGTHYIRVTPHEDSVSGTYSIRVLPRYDEPGASWDATSFEPDNASTNSYPIAVGAQGQLRSTIEQQSGYYTPLADQDWYRFDAVQGKTYKITLSTIDSSLYLQTGYKCSTYGRKGLWLELFDPDGLSVQKDCDQNDTVLEFEAGKTGTYTFQVAPHADTVNGSYSVRVQQAYCKGVTEISQSHCELLVLLYETLDGPNWTNKAGWLTTTTPCSWDGVTCTGNQITGLNLSSNNLRGTLPQDIGTLNNLSSLRLDGNPNLTGSLPADMTRMSGLDTLRFATTDLCEPSSETFQTWIDGVREADRANLCDDASIAFDKTVSKPTAQHGDTLTYSLVASGGGGAVEFDLADILPAGLTYVNGSVTGGATYTTGSRKITYNGIVSATQTITITYQATVDSTVADGTIIANDATVTTSEQVLEQSVSVSVANPKQINTLVLLYYGADNNLALDGITLLNSAEKAADNANATILMMLDGPTKEDAYLYLVQPDTQAECPDYANPTCNGHYVLGQTMWEWSDQTADAAALADFIQGALLAYPNANQVILSIIGHGNGISAEGLNDQPSSGRSKRFDPLAGLLVDENPPFTSLSTRGLGDGLRMGLAQAQQAGATRSTIDGLYLDACLMGMFEIAYEVRDSVSYLLASPNTKWAVSEYDAHINQIDGQRTVLDILKAWQANESSILKGNDPQPYTYAVINLANIEALRKELDDLAAALVATLPDNKTRIQTAYNGADFFDSNGDGSLLAASDTYVDLLSFVNQLSSQFSTNTAVQNATNDVKAKLSDIVVANDHQNGIPWTYPTQTWAWQTYGGLSIYAPFTENERQRRYYTGRHFQAANDGQWDDFLAAFWGEDPPTKPGTGLPLARQSLRSSVSFITITAKNTSIREGESPGIFTVTRTGDTIDNSLVVSYTLSGTASNGTDYTALSGNVTIPAGSDHATLTITAPDDNEKEGDEKVIVTLGADTSYALATPSSAAMTIVDAVVPIVGITASVATANEGGSSGTFTITRTGNLASALVVDYTISGTASNGTDYTKLSGSVTIPAGKDSATLTITAQDDGKKEGNETVIITLTPNTSYALGTSTSAAMTIVDAVVPIVGITASVATANEGGSSGTFTITRTGNLASSLVVGYTVSGTAKNGTDYTKLSGSVTIPAGSDHATLTITAPDDKTLEGSETVIVSLSPPLSGYTLADSARATITIHDASTPSFVGITATVSTTVEGGTHPGTFTITRTGSLASSLIVGYTTSGTAKAGTDYTALSNSVTIPAGSDHITLTVSAKADDVQEGNETVIVTLTTPQSGYILADSASATVTIQDSKSDPTNQEVPIVRITTNISTSIEGGDPGTMIITRTGRLDNSLVVSYTVGGTANAGVDYTALSDSVTIPAGSNRATLTIVAQQDNQKESDETVIVTLTPHTTYALADSVSASVTIQDSSSGPPDVTFVGITATTESPVEGSRPGTFTITRTGTTDTSLVVKYAVSGTATAGEDYTTLPDSITIPAGLDHTILTVTALIDQEQEDDETIIITLLSDAAYTLTPWSKASMTIRDNRNTHLLYLPLVIR